MLRKDNSKVPKKGKKLESTKTQEETVSVHKKNLFIISYPIIFLFVIFRSILHHLFLLLKAFGTLISSSKFNYKSSLQKNKEEILSIANSNEVSVVETDKMIGANKAQPGPGDTLLVKQKQHHRKAFEYISKALKIDEENEGNYIYIVMSFLILYFKKIFNHFLKIALTSI